MAGMGVGLLGIAKNDWMLLSRESETVKRRGAADQAEDPDIVG